MDSVGPIFLTGADGDCGEKFSPALRVHLCSVCGEVSPTNCPQSDASEVSFTHELPLRGGRGGRGGRVGCNASGLICVRKGTPHCLH